jgi:hypothetical protein
MRTLFNNLDLKVILLIPVLVAYAIFRVLRVGSHPVFHIAPKSWTVWFWGQTSEKKSVLTSR